ncbi:MAG: SOS response-associated peptidase [Elusimicrobiota bacterium]
MCGRYSQTASLKELRERFGFAASEVTELKPRYNIAPTQDAPVLVDDGGLALKMFRWGLIPSWSKDAAIGHKPINARAETVAEKPSFRKPLRSRRCLVLADGFYEWRVLPGGGKQPLRAALKSREPFTLAGLWDEWKSPDGKSVRTFTIVTAEAEPSFREIHTRMPVLLDPKDRAPWLDAKTPVEELLPLLHARPGLETYAVSTLVNSPRNDVPACLEPAV